MSSPVASIDRPALERLMRLGVERWPGVRLEPEEFQTHLASVGEGPLEARATEDLFLAAACLRGDPAALAHLEAKLLRPVGAYLSALESGPALADEVRQA